MQAIDAKAALWTYFIVAFNAFNATIIINYSCVAPLELSNLLDVMHLACNGIGLN